MPPKNRPRPPKPQKPQKPAKKVRSPRIKSTNGKHVCTLCDTEYDALPVSLQGAQGLKKGPAMVRRKCTTCGAASEVHRNRGNTDLEVQEEV